MDQKPEWNAPLVKLIRRRKQTSEWMSDWSFKRKTMISDEVVQGIDQHEHLQEGIRILSLFFGNLERV